MNSEKDGHSEGGIERDRDKKEDFRKAGK